MDLDQQVKITDDIHDTLTNLIGETIEVRANLGRSKIAIYKGELTGTYPAVFTMEAERKRGRTSRQSFQYVDILTGVVEAYDSKGNLIFDQFIIDEEASDKQKDEVMLGGSEKDAKDVLAALQASGEEMLGEPQVLLTDSDNEPDISE